MHTRRVGNFADRLSGFGVNNHHFGRTGNVEAMRVAIGFQIIPSTFAAEFPRVDDMVAGSSRQHYDRQEKNQSAGENDIDAFHDVLTERGTCRIAKAYRTNLKEG